MTATLAKEVSKLSVAEKIRLVEDLWDEVAIKGEELPVPASHKRAVGCAFGRVPEITGVRPHGWMNVLPASGSMVVNYPLRLHPELVEDAHEPFAWYEAAATGLGHEFLRSYSSRLWRLYRASHWFIPWSIEISAASCSGVFRMRFTFKSLRTRWWFFCSFIVPATRPSFASFAGERKPGVRNLRHLEPCPAHGRPPCAKMPDANRRRQNPA